MKAAERAERDAKALELFLGGANYREIGAQLVLTARRVEDIVKRELGAAAKRRLVLQDEALAVHQERTERLFAQQWKRAEAGDQRAAEICERMLSRNVRLYSLAEEISLPPLPSPTPPRTTGPSDDDGDDEPEDELARLRAARTSG